jgi:cysteinyl-tRNA synthetase
MSKSLGNSLFLKDLLDRYSPETVKFALLQTNYRADINVTDNLFPDAEKHLVEFYTLIDLAKKKGIEITGENKDIDSDFDKAMDNDFNTALALSNLFTYFKKIKGKINADDKSAGADINQIIKTYSLLGLFETDEKEFIEKFGEKGEEIPAEIIDMAEKMQKARGEKDYATADELRQKITDAGYIIKISKDGYTVEKK